MTDSPKPAELRERLQQAIAALEAQRGSLDAAALETALASLREKLAAVEAEPTVEHRKQVTVLFADLAGFTALSEHRDPEDVREILETYYGHMAPLITRFGGVVEKFIGDAVMAVFGIRVAREGDPANAVRAALAMQQALAEINAELARPYSGDGAGTGGVRLAMRVGVHTGPVFVGALGGEGETFKVAGETVTLASRLEHAAPPGGVLISQATYDATRGRFDVRAEAPLAVRGRSEPLLTYLVVREKPRAFHLEVRGIAGVTTVTVGRDAELAELHAAYARAVADGRVQWVTVTGEAGVGKTRLLLEFERWLDLRPEEIWYLKGRAWPETEHTPYALLRDLLSFRFEIHDGDPLLVAHEKLLAGFTDLLGPELGEEAAAFIGQLAGFDFRDHRWIAHIVSDTRQVRGRAAVLLARTFAALGALRPVVLLLEDLHWADAESRILLQEVLLDPAGSPSAARAWPLCVISSARPSLWESGPAWDRTPAGAPIAGHVRLDLALLAAGPAEALARELLQNVPQPPEWLVELLVERGGGNPYFTEELVHWLIEQGVIVPGPETWAVRSDPSLGLSVPGTIQGVLQARLEGLGQDERALLQQAAVVGRAFWAEAVAYIGGSAVAPERWDALQRRDLVFRQAASQLPDMAEYHFKHALLRDVVYEYTLKKQRRAYHRRAAEWLAQAAAERVSEWAAVIAGHYERAGEAGETAAWYGRAAAQAQATYAPGQAIEYYRRALACLPHGAAGAAQRAEFDAGLGQILFDQARYAEAIGAFREMQTSAEEAGDQRRVSGAWKGLSLVQDRMGDYRAALGSATRAEEAARHAGMPADMAAAWVLQGWAHLRTGSAQAAVDLAERALELATAEGHRPSIGSALNLLGGVHMSLGRPDTALDHMQRALAVFRELGDRNRACAILNNLGAAAHRRGDYAAAAALLGEADAIAGDIGSQITHIIALSNLGAAHVALGEHAAAEAELREAIRLAEAAGRGGLAGMYCILAEACLGLGRPDDAVAAAQRGLALAKAMERREEIGWAWRVLGQVAARDAGGRVAARAGEPAVDAPACFAESLRILAEIHVDVERAQTLRAWARFERLRGDVAHEAELWREAREIFARLGMEPEVQRMDQERPPKP